jgi:hypothetical protein
MKVVCIHKSTSKHMKSHYFTVGKQYDCEIIDVVTNSFIKQADGSSLIYEMTNDEGMSRSFSKIRFNKSFTPLSQLREDKLKELGI